MSKRTYGTRWCYVCGKEVSRSGAAWTSHCRQHVREGKMTEDTHYDSRGREYKSFDHVVGTKFVQPPPRPTAKPNQS